MKNTRYQSSISKCSEDDDHWLKEFKNKLEKGAVQPKSTENIYDQINSIMNNKSKYPSVEAAVEDMKQRSGLIDYLKKINKIASDNNSAIDKNIPIEEIKVPVVIQKCPAIKNTLENIIHDTNGNSSLPAIIDRLKSIHKTDVHEDKDWEDQLLIIFVGRLNLQEKAKQSKVDNNNLGIRDTSMSSDIDPSNTDAFSILMPAKL